MKATRIDIPSLGYSALCPVTALLAMLATLSTNADSPLIQVPHGQPFKPLTDSAVRKRLKSVSALLGISRSLTFHDFHKGGLKWCMLLGLTSGPDFHSLPLLGVWGPVNLHIIINL